MSYHDPQTSSAQPQGPSIYSDSPPFDNPVGPAGHPPAAHAAPRPTNTLAGVSLGLGVAGLFIPFVCIAAVVTGHLARRAIRQTGEGGQGMAVGGLVLGYVVLALSVAGTLLVLALLTPTVDHISH